MKKALKRAIAALFGLALSLALIGPIQSARLADAICSNNPDDIYAYVQYVDYTYAEVKEVTDYTDSAIEGGWYNACEGWSIRGAYVDNDGKLSWIVLVGDNIFIFNFDPIGTLEGIA